MLQRVRSAAATRQKIAADTASALKQKRIYTQRRRLLKMVHAVAITYVVRTWQLMIESDTMVKMI